MKPSQTIFYKNNGTVTISLEEYNRLVRNSNLLEDYKAMCQEMKEVLKGEGGAK